MSKNIENKIEDYNSIFPLGTVMRPLEKPHIMNYGSVVLFMCLLSIFSIFFGGIISVITAISVPSLGFICYCHFKYRGEMEKIDNLNNNKDTFSYSRKHSFIVNDANCFSIIFISIFTIFLIFVAASDNIRCNLSDWSVYLIYLCDDTLSNYENHINFGRSLYFLVFFAYFPFAIFALIMVYIAYSRIKNSIKITQVDKLSHLCSVTFVGFMIVGLLSMVFGRYYFGIYDGEPSYRVSRKIKLYFWYIYFLVFPFLLFFLIQAFSSILILFSARERLHRVGSEK